MKIFSWIMLATTTLSTLGCVVVPTNAQNHVAKCEISSDKLTLKVIDVAKSTNSYYSIEGLILTPILYPSTAIVSSIFVAANNIYHLGEEKLVCGKTE